MHRDCAAENVRALDLIVPGVTDCIATYNVEC